MLLWILITLPVLTVAKCPFPEAYESIEYDMCYVAAPFTASWGAAESIFTTILHLDATWIGAFITSGDHWSWTDGSRFNYSNFDWSGYGPVARLISRWPSGQPADGVWEEEEDELDIRDKFMCQIPKCSNCQSSPSLLSTTDNSTGLLFNSQTNFWYYGNQDMKDQTRRSDSFCQQLGGHLPSISNGFENTWLQKAFKTLNGKEHSRTDEYFSLGYFSDSKGTWQWTDGNTASYTNWEPREPENGQGIPEYGIMSMLGGKWRSDIGFDYFYYMCALPAQKNYCI